MAMAGLVQQLCFPLLQCKSSIRQCPLKTKTSHKAMTSNSSMLAFPVAMFGLREPPYKLSELEPFMSQNALKVHWGKHHWSYVDNLNKQIEGTYLQSYTLEELIRITYNNGNPMPAFNNAAQVFNHNLFWESIEPNGGGKCEGIIKGFIERDFGSCDNFIDELKNAAISVFGSGWVWLSVSVKEPKLVLEKSQNAMNPLLWDHIPLLALDVWEHAYYLDYQNRRADYVSVLLKHLISWKTVNHRFLRAQAFVNFGKPVVPEL